MNIMVASIVTRFFITDYIVVFNAYHSEKFRQSSISSALCSFTPHFSFVPRNYSFVKGLSTSDFEIIQVNFAYNIVVFLLEI